MFEGIILTLVTIVLNCAYIPQLISYCPAQYFFSFLDVLHLCNYLGYDRHAT